jgi:hypothetical protein
MTSPEHFDQFLVLTAAGAALALTGVANLLFGRRAAVRAVAGLVVCGLAVAALAALAGPELSARAATVLAGVLAAVGLSGSGWVHRRVAAVAAALRRPAPRWGAVAACGVGLVVAAAARFDADERAQLEKDALDLELAVGRPPQRPTDRAHAATDRGTAVVLREPLSPRAADALSDPEEQVLRGAHLDDQVIRHGEPSDLSNCHGWVFTGGRFLLSGEDVELILRENGYAEVAEPHPGDVAVYRQGGAVAHTALVRYVSEGQPVLVEGKWGTMGVFLHPADKSPYGTEYTFHRSPRRGHLLAGLGGPAPGASAAPAGRPPASDGGAGATHDAPAARAAGVFVGPSRLHARTRRR